MSWVGVAVGVGGAVIGGMNAANAAGDAADAQVQSSQEANALQLRMFEEGRADQRPWIDRGNAAGNLLQYYLGIDPNGASGGGAGGNNYGLGAAPTIDQFTTRPMTQVMAYGPPSGGDQRANGTFPVLRPQTVPGAPVVDQAGFQSALSSYNQKLEAARAGALAGANGDPRFGSLLKPFTGDSVATDPGYQFGLRQGSQAITNQRASLGSLLSGATLKDLTQFGNDYGGTKFNEAFSRDQANKQLTNNMLAGVSGTGQATANNVSGNSNLVGGSVGQNIIGAGNARASGYVGSANAINSAIGTGINQYNSANLLKSLNSRTGPAGDMIVRNGGADPYDV